MTLQRAAIPSNLNINHCETKAFLHSKHPSGPSKSAEDPKFNHELYGRSLPLAAARAAPVMNPSNASPRLNTSISSTLRPRNRRLISGLDDEPSLEVPSSASASGSASPRDSPSRDPSRTQFRTSSSQASRGIGPLSGAWSNSLSTLQSLASDVLGGDRGSGGISTMRQQWPTRGSWRRKPTSTPKTAWGPTGMEHNQIGAGSKEDREALVREAKRKDLLTGDCHSLPDSSGRFKRRNSDGPTAGSSPPEENDSGDALVYIHRVRPGDTLAGLTIRYSCQPAVLRKANRMWPNDPIQTRETIVLPVDACGVKGRRVSSPQKEVEEEDLIGDETFTMHEGQGDSSESPMNGWHKDSIPRSQSNPPEHRPPSSAASLRLDAEPQWKHDSWVLLPNDTQPTEIARLPRRTLGFFPRARRKSNTFSDIGTSRNTSFDLVRSNSASPFIAPVQAPQLGSPSLRPFSSSRPSSRPPVSTSRARSASNSMAAFLHGPGGVGTLGKSARAPGPAPDRLNALLGPHLPSVAPPPNQTVFTPWAPGMLNDDLISFGSGGSGAPVDGGAGGGPGIDLQDVGGAIEGWVRKMAKRATTALEANAAIAAAKGNAGVQGMGMGGGAGDLIELVDAFEIGDGEEARLGDNSILVVDRTDTGTSGRSSGDIRGRRRVRGSSSKSDKDD